MTPTVVDNFLPKFFYQPLLRQIYSEGFSWFYVDEPSGGIKPNKVKGVHFPENQFGFSHLAYKSSEGGAVSNIYQSLVPMINLIEESFDITVNELLRVRLGMTTSMGEGGNQYPHVDAQFPHYTLLYYLDESDGDTIFYDQHYTDGREMKDFSVAFANSPKANQAILFNGLQFHSSGIPEKYSRRTTININFL